MTLEEFKAKCEERNIELSDKMIEQFNTYAAYLKEYNEKTVIKMLIQNILIFRDSRQIDLLVVFL